MGKYLGDSMYVLLTFSYHNQYSNIEVVLLIHRRRKAIVFEMSSLLPTGRNDQYYMVHRWDNRRALRQAS